MEWKNVVGANTSRRQRLLMRGFIMFKGTSAFKEVVTTPMAEAYVVGKPPVIGKEAFVVVPCGVVYHPLDESDIHKSKVKTTLIMDIGKHAKVIDQTLRPTIFLIPSAENRGTYLEDYFSLIQYIDRDASTQEGWILTSSLVGAY